MQKPEQAGDKRHKAFHDTCQHNEEQEVATQEFGVLRSKIFNFHSVRSAIIGKLKAKGSQETDTIEYKFDTGTDGNLMLI